MNNDHSRVAELEAALASEREERISLERQLESLVAERELILHEVHHRIKNNMSTIVNLLSMQADSLRDRTSADILRQAASRIKSMGVLYDKLYRSDKITDLSLRNYLPSLAEEVISLVPSGDHVTLKTSVEDIAIDAQRLSSLGIVANELIFNSLKHAFPDGRAGTITVAARRDGNEAVVLFADDGVGIPEGYDASSGAHFGLSLVAGLVAQIGGKIKLSREGGTSYEIRFPIE